MWAPVLLFEPASGRRDHQHGIASRCHRVRHRLSWRPALADVSFAGRSAVVPLQRGCALQAPAMSGPGTCAFRRHVGSSNPSVGSAAVPLALASCSTAAVKRSKAALLRAHACLRRPQHCRFRPASKAPADYPCLSLVGSVSAASAAPRDHRDLSPSLQERMRCR